MSKISVVGIGPGGLDEITPRARNAIDAAQVVAGYNTYIKLIEPLLDGKKNYRACDDAGSRTLTVGNRRSFKRS